VTRDIAAAVSRAGTATVAGRFQRHVSPRQEPLRGSRAGGRWGPEGTYPVLYLGRPTDSVIVEAYRHLVETVEGMQPQMAGPRRLVTCTLPYNKLAEWYGVFAASGQRGLAELRDKGLLHRERHRRRDPESPVGFADVYHYQLLPPFGPNGEASSAQPKFWKGPAPTTKKKRRRTKAGWTKSKQESS